MWASGSLVAGAREASLARTQGATRPPDASDRGRRQATPIAFLLPAVVGEGLIRLGHAVDVVLALVGAALLGLGVEQLACQSGRHRLLAAGPGELHEPAHRQG